MKRYLRANKSFDSRIDINDIRGATILSIEEVRSLPNYVKADCYGDCYWLKAPKNRPYQLAKMDFSGYVDIFDYSPDLDYVANEYGDYVCNKEPGFSISQLENGVRPVLIVPDLKSYNFHDYEMIELFNYDWYVLNDFGYLLCRGRVAFVPYTLDDNGNTNYVGSYIQQYLKDWFAKLIQEK